MIVPRIAVGLALVDDDGDEVVVHKIDQGRGTVTLLTEDGDRYGMSIRDLRSKLRDGDFAQVVDNGAEEISERAVWHARENDEDGDDG